jgi:hypothetical protein
MISERGHALRLLHRSGARQAAIAEQADLIRPGVQQLTERVIEALRTSILEPPGGLARMKFGCKPDALGSRWSASCLLRGRGVKHGDVADGCPQGRTAADRVAQRLTQHKG